MTKIFVLDTSVLLHDPGCLRKFEENEVVIPITSIEEMDTFKKDQREIGRNARQVARFLKDLMSEGSIKSGVVINEKGGTLRVSLTSDEAWVLGTDFDPKINDNKILNCAAFNSGILVSNDVNLRIKAEACGLNSEDYNNDKVDTDDFYKGFDSIWASAEWIDTFYKTKVSPFTPLSSEDLYPNQCYLIQDNLNAKHSALGRYHANLKQLELIEDIEIMKLAPRNMEQRFALDMLLDPSIKLVTLIGKAGSGKSLMALLAGLHQTLSDAPIYKKILVYRPIVPMGNDIGYLPGSMEEKMGPWMQPISDNIDFIIGDAEDDSPKKKTKKAGKNLDEYGEKDAARRTPTTDLISFGLLELGVLTYIRGRSIPNQYLVIDEAQNCSIHEIKTIITRVGEGTKIILTGDPSQIDAPYLDSTNNGLTYAAEKFKNQSIAGHIVFSKSERSELAEIAANIL